MVAPVSQETIRHIDGFMGLYADWLEARAAYKRPCRNASDKLVDRLDDERDASRTYTHTQIDNWIVVYISTSCAYRTVDAQTMARRNISVPDDLADRMDRLSDRVIWSTVAKAAFEAEIRRHPEWKEDKMSAVAERLRASREAATVEKEDEGFKCGRLWAKIKPSFSNYKGWLPIALKQCPQIGAKRSSLIGSPLSLPAKNSTGTSATNFGKAP